MRGEQCGKKENKEREKSDWNSKFIEGRKCLTRNRQVSLRAMQRATVHTNGGQQRRQFMNEISKISPTLKRGRMESKFSSGD